MAEQEDHTVEDSGVPAAPASKPRWRRGRIVTVVVAGVVIAGASFGGGVAVGATNASPSSTHAQFGQGGPGATGGRTGTGTGSGTAGGPPGTSSGTTSTGS